MISALTGLLVAKAPGMALVDVNGVGYEVSMPVSAVFQLPELGERVALHTVLHFRDDGVRLYGFLSPAEKLLFTVLQSVSGVGARTALEVLGGTRVQDFIRAIQLEDVRFLKKIPGIGPKTAERLIFELRSKLEALSALAVAPPVRAETEAERRRNEALQALMALGTKPPVAQRAVELATAVLPEDASVADWIKEALKHR